MPTTSALALGTSDFRKIRERGKLYVDKTALITEVLADPAEVLLLPRPRRFGKTTNLTTLRCFLEKSPEDLSHLFRDLAVWRSEAARVHFQKYPVIFVSFRDIEAMSLAACLDRLTVLISERRRWQARRVMPRTRCRPGSRAKSSRGAAGLDTGRQTPWMPCPGPCEPAGRRRSRRRSCACGRGGEGPWLWERGAWHHGALSGD